MRRDKNRNAKSGGFYFFQYTAGNIADRQNNGSNINIIRARTSTSSRWVVKQSGHARLAAIFKLFIFLSLF
jgi:hypothetical protein